MGREHHLAELKRAFDTMLTGTPTVATVYGPSGIGKSVLVRTFIDGLQAGHPDAVVLTGRCYERESVPYKALDNLIDALARYLKHLPAHAVEALMPRAAGVLAHVFPVLRQFDERQPRSRRIAEPELVVPSLALLRSEHLVRARGTDRGTELEAYHERIREAVVAGLDAGESSDCQRLPSIAQPALPPPARAARSGFHRRSRSDRSE